MSSMFDANRPVVLPVRPVAELICDVPVQGGGGGVGAGPAEPSASVTCIVRGQTDWWPRSHCTTQKHAASGGSDGTAFKCLL